MASLLESLIMPTKGYSTPLIATLSTCPQNCSGNGECLRGMCICDIQYTGRACNETNLSYYISFSTFFYLVCITAIMQLILRIRSEHTDSQPRVLRRCSIDIQKLVYLFVICATGSRAVYFTIAIDDNIPDIVKKILFFPFYPFILSGFSVIICFWAESFHLSGLQLDKPRFLTKSFYGFVTFNVVVYFILINQVIANHILNSPLVKTINEVFNGCVAFLMFLVLVFFLIYGVEIFCKIKGAFKKEEVMKHIDMQQLFQSRFGLWVQAVFQLALTLFLIHEVLEKVYEKKLSMFDRNILKILLHLAELGCVMWFPCCLWNVNKPGELWILNPQKLYYVEGAPRKEKSPLAPAVPGLNYDTFHGKVVEKYNDEAQLIPTDEKEGIICDLPSVTVCKKSEDGNDGKTVNAEGECWVCYDNESTDVLIQPCECKGDMKLVHHDCLKKWIVEKSLTGEIKEEHTCDVCKAMYQVKSNTQIFCPPNKKQFNAWAQTSAFIIAMTIIPLIIYFVWHKIPNVATKAAVVAMVLFTEYCLFRLFGFNFIKAYKITKRRAVIILG